ncbi:MAG: glycosyltransferase family 4 protein [Planctomycetia bacterium]|nr:glycosyltransferase family 4 protein [Planctomycetia bacterium]
MRIAHVITRMILGGAQENTLLACLDLRDLYGDDVLLMTGPALGPEGTLLEEAQRAGLPVVVIDSLRRAIHPWRDWQSYRALRRELARFQPDVVHTHSAKGGMLGRIAATSLGVPAVVHTVHGAPFHPYQSGAPRALFRACERYAARKCHALVSVADAMTDLMVEAAVAPRSKFTTIYSGMNVEPFLAADATRDHVRRQLGYSHDDVVVGKVARLFHLKGHEYLIRAAEQAVEQNPNLRFLLVGDGILQTPLQEQIERAGLTRYFHFTGLVTPDRVAELVGAMDIVVHVSLREGLARVLPQALIAGRPVISYDIDGAREVVLPDQTGVLLPPREVDGLAAAMVRLAADPALRARLGAEGRRRFVDVFRHQQTSAAQRALYQQLLARGPRAEALAAR